MVSTCNRTELYVVGADRRGRRRCGAGAPRRREPPALYAERNCDAARHLYRVVSGLESMIVGEAEIQGQVKRAYERALAARTTGPLTNRLFRAALATGKRVRTETAISTGHASVATVAVDAAARRARRAGPPPRGDRRRRRHVRADRAGVPRPRRDDDVRRQPPPRPRDRAGRALRRRVGSFDALPGELERADVVVSSTASPHAIIGAEELAAVMEARERRPLLLVDLAVPRDIDRRARRVDGVTLLDMDALQASVARQPAPCAAARRAAPRRSSRTRSRRSRAGSGGSRSCRR